MRDEFKSSSGSGSNHVDSKILLIGILMAGLLIGSGASYLGLNHGEVSKQKAGQMVVDTLEQTSNADYTVNKVTQENGMYRVQLQTGQNSLETYFVTKNGQFLSTQLTDMQQVQETVQTQQDVQSCLSSKNVTMYGNITQQQTQLQIQVLGGAQAVSTYYSDVNNPQNLQRAVQSGAQSVPAMVMNGQVLQGVNNLNEIQSWANCN